MRRAIAVSIFSIAFAATSFAETSPSPKLPGGLVRGTISSFDGHVLSVSMPSGEVIAGMVSDKSRIFAVEAIKFEQLKATDFVGVTAVDGTNGHLRAEEIHVIPIAGVGEGQYPWDHHPDNASAGPVRAGSMTNGTVETAMPMRAGSMTNGTIGSAAEHQLTLSFRGSQIVNGKCEGRATTGATVCIGKATVDVTPQTYIAALVPASIGDLKAGLAVVASIGAAPDGKLFVGSATIEKNGVKPEF
jgi:hypothetical protein